MVQWRKAHLGEKKKERERPKETKTIKPLGQMIDMRGRGRGGWAKSVSVPDILQGDSPIEKCP